MADNNSTIPTDSLLGLADRKTEIVVIMVLIVAVVAVLSSIAWFQRRKLRENTRMAKKK